MNKPNHLSLHPMTIPFIPLSYKQCKKNVFLYDKENQLFIKSSEKDLEILIDYPFKNSTDLYNEAYYDGGLDG